MLRKLRNALRAPQAAILQADLSCPLCDGERTVLYLADGRVCHWGAPEQCPAMVGTCWLCSGDGTVNEERDNEFRQWSEHQWRCSLCGHVNDRVTSVCARCGDSISEKEDRPPVTWSWERRVREGKVAHILAMISAPPNRRKRPRDGDLIGEFDEWFDGGALRVVTGYTEYGFSDGTRAVVDVHPYLNASITLPDGNRVQIRQDRQ